MINAREGYVAWLMPKLKYAVMSDNIEYVKHRLNNSISCIEMLVEENKALKETIKNIKEKSDINESNTM